VRPTTDFAKEGLFNVLNNQKDIEGCSVLDLCCGTGNMTFEFTSRGAASVMAVDQHFGCLRYVKKLAGELGFEGIHTFKSELFQYVNRLSVPYDIIFADPPYALEGVDKLAEMILKKGVLKEGGLLIIEHSKQLDYSKEERFLFSRKYGNVNFTFFE
jgi:16S rRNA (guanine(966)-N(2))-methyltransferase RsmD